MLTGATVVTLVFWILVAVMPDGHVRLWSKPFPTQQHCEDTRKEAQAKLQGSTMYCVQNTVPRKEG